MIDKNKKILIIGLGLIGGSYAKGLTKNGYYVGAITKTPSSIEYALKENIITTGSTDISKEYVSSFDIVVFALYPKVLLEWVAEYGTYFKKGAIITDVTGVKSEIVSKVQEMLPDNVEFIGAHPMAGKEVYGIENSDDAIFKAANYIVTPTDKNTKEAIEICKDLARILGFKNIAELSPEKHDEMIGFLSQLTHCIAVALMTSKDSEHLVEYTGDSFRDLTRIAQINDAMWSELFLMNKEVLVEQMNLFMNEFIKLKEAIVNEDRKTMREMMQLSTYRRVFFNKK